MTYFSQDPLCSYLDEQQKNDIYFLNNCRDVSIVPTFARQKRLADFVIVDVI